MDEQSCAREPGRRAVAAPVNRLVTLAVGWPRTSRASVVTLVVALSCQQAGGVAGPAVSPSPTPAPAGTLSIVATIAVDHEPSAVAVNATTNRIYVAHAEPPSQSRPSGSSNTVVIDGATNQIVARVALGSPSSAIAVNEATDRIYVASVGNNVSVIDGVTSQVVAEVAVGQTVLGIAVNATTGRIYVASLQ